MSLSTFKRIAYFVFIQGDKQRTMDFMKDNDLLPKDQETFFEEFYVQISKEDIPPHRGDLVLQFYNQFKSRNGQPISELPTQPTIPSTITSPSWRESMNDQQVQVNVVIDSNCQYKVKSIRKYITNNEDLDDFFTKAFQHFVQQYKNIETITPHSFPTIRVKETYYTDRKLVPNDFEHTFVPKGVELKFSCKKFDKNQIIKAKVSWNNNSSKMVQEDEIWENFEKFLGFYYGEGIPAIKREVLEKGLAETLDQLIESDQVIKRIKPALVSYGVCSMKDETFPRGSLFHGPPGVGKTSLMKRICKALHLPLLSNPLTAGDFEQGIVGDSAKMINHLGDRALAVPWQIFILAIDEVEALVKSRDSQKGDASILSVILGLITGIKDIPNLVVFCATNHIEMIDDAFLRRMTIKSFVGKPSYEGRKEWIARSEKKGDVIFDGRSTVESVVAMTLNFSHDGMLQLLKSLKDNLMYEGREEKVTKEYAKKFILSICKSERIIFGKYFLPNLLESSNKVEISKLDLSKDENEAFSGKILVDLNSYLQMETLDVNNSTSKSISDIVRKFINNDSLMSTIDLTTLISLGVTLNTFDISNFASRMEKNEIQDEDIINAYQMMMKTELKEKYLKDPITAKLMDVSKVSIENVLSSLIQFGKLNKFHVVYYVDSHTFHSNNRFSQESQQKYIQALHKECEEYSSSMVIYDLDSIVELYKSYSGFKDDVSDYFGKSSGGISAPNFSYHIGKPDVLMMILEKFKSLSVSTLKKSWIVLIVKHPYLKKIVKDAGFPLTVEELDIIKKENQNPMKICINCHQEYNLNDNTSMKCRKHRLDNFFFQSSGIEKKTTTKIYSKSEMEMKVIDAELSGEFEFFQHNVKHVCCGGGVYSNGCVPCNHQSGNEKDSTIPKKTNNSPLKSSNSGNSPKGNTTRKQNVVQSHPSNHENIKMRYESMMQEKMSEEESYLVVSLIEQNMTEEEIISTLLNLK